jgi:hypothetical protein
MADNRTNRGIVHNAREGHSDEAVTDAKDTSPEAEESQIVHRVNTVDPNTGQAKLVEHGPMPVSQWAKYEKENNL